MDRDLRALMRDPSAPRDRLLRAADRAGVVEQYPPNEIEDYEGRQTVFRLRTGWVMVPRGKVPRAERYQPRVQYDLVTTWTPWRAKPGEIRAVVPRSWWIQQADRVGQDVVDRWLDASHRMLVADEGPDARAGALVKSLACGPALVMWPELPTTVEGMERDVRFRIATVGLRSYVVALSTEDKWDSVVSAAKQVALGRGVSSYEGRNRYLALSDLRESVLAHGVVTANVWTFALRLDLRCLRVTKLLVDLRDKGIYDSGGAWDVRQTEQAWEVRYSPRGGCSEVSA